MKLFVSKGSWYFIRFTVHYVKNLSIDLESPSPQNHAEGFYSYGIGGYMLWYKEPYLLVPSAWGINTCNLKDTSSTLFEEVGGVSLGRYHHLFDEKQWLKCLTQFFCKPNIWLRLIEDYTIINIYYSSFKNEFMYTALFNNWRGNH